jgi:hypothetical protein
MNAFCYDEKITLTVSWKVLKAGRAKSSEGRVDAPAGMTIGEVLMQQIKLGRNGPTVSAFGVGRLWTGRRQGVDRHHPGGA